jgi:hypothetical protein
MTGSATVVTSEDRDVPPREGSPGRWRRLWGSAAFVREAVLIVAVDELYEVTRSLAPTRVGKALANARAIERLERTLHLNPERPLNHALLDVPVLIPPISVYYQVGHLVALLAALIWAWRRHRELYRAARNALLALTLGGLAWYWLMPTAPPRFALPGVVDVVAAHPVLLASQESVVGLVNEYAAMPSLHVAWAVWVALTATTLSARRLRWLAWVHPVATTLVVLATANHYLLDALAGTVLAFVAWLLAGPPRLAGLAGLAGPPRLTSIVQRPLGALAGRRPSH